MYKLITIFFLALLSFTSCKKDEYGFTSRPYADVPVTVTNRVAHYNGVPYVETSKSGSGVINITLEIPSSSGRTIKEITRVGTSNSIEDYRVVQSSTATGANYITAPIPASGTSVTFTTSLTEYAAKNTGLTGGTVPATVGTNNSFLGRYFYFMLTLDNGQQLIVVPVRVYVNT
jgi:hypothetical protein